MSSENAFLMRHSSSILQTKEAQDELLDRAIPSMEKQEFLEFVHRREVEHELEIVSIFKRYLKKNPGDKSILSFYTSYHGNEDLGGYKILNNYLHELASRA